MDRQKNVWSYSTLGLHVCIPPRTKWISIHPTHPVNTSQCFLVTIVIHQSSTYIYAREIRQYKMILLVGSVALVLKWIGKTLCSHEVDLIVVWCLEEVHGTIRRHLVRGCQATPCYPYWHSESHVAYCSNTGSLLFSQEFYFVGQMKYKDHVMRMTLMSHRTHMSFQRSSLKSVTKRSR